MKHLATDGKTTMVLESTTDGDTVVAFNEDGNVKFKNNKSDTPEILFDLFCRQTETVQCELGSSMDMLLRIMCPFDIERAIEYAI